MMSVFKYQACQAKQDSSLLLPLPSARLRKHTSCFQEFKRNENGSIIMSILQRIRERAAANLKHIVLPEGEDPRTVIAASICAREKIARITLLGAEDKIRSAAQSNGVDLGGVQVIDHKKAADFDKMASFYHELRRAKGMLADEARAAVADPLYYGNLLVRMRKADGSVAGAVNTTAHTVRAAMHCIGIKVGFRLVSSFFVMVLPNSAFGENGTMIFAD